MREINFLDTVTKQEMERSVQGMTEVAVLDDRMAPLICKGDRVVYDMNYKEIYESDTVIVAEHNGEVVVRFATQDKAGIIRLRALSGDPAVVEVAPDDRFTVKGRGMFVHELIKDKDGGTMAIRAKPLPMPDIPHDPLIENDPRYDDPESRWNVSKLHSVDPEDFFSEDPAARTLMSFDKARREGGEIKALTAQDKTMEPDISKGDRVLYDTSRNEISSEYAKPFAVEINGRTLIREAWIDENGTTILRPYSFTARAIAVEPSDDFKVLGEMIGVASVRKGPPKTPGSKCTIKIGAKNIRKPRKLH